MRLHNLLSVIGLLSVLTLPVISQVNTGSMSGVVNDPQGAAIPGVKVVARHEPTGVVFETLTTEAGFYSLPALPVGVYTVTVEHPGFKKLVRSGIEIRIAQRQPLDLKLEIGDVVETVEVTAAAPLLASQTSEVATNFSPTFMNNAPLFTGGIRNPSVFVTYMPGVNQIGDAGNQSINGGPRRGKESVIDGGSHISPESGGVVFDWPSAEQFSEFRLLTSTFSAEYGRTGGGIEIFVTRSGTNEFHGSAYWNLRRDIFNAAGWSVNQDPRNRPGFRPKERFNEIGGALGGPVWLPKMYDGRNKSFFFFTYVKDARPASATPITSTVPTARMKRGDFGELGHLIYDPATTSGVGAAATRMPFPGNTIPTARFSRVSQRLLPLFPDPPLPGITTNLPFVNTLVMDRYMWSIKIDHKFTDNNRVSVYFNTETNEQMSVEFLPGPLSHGNLSFRYPKRLRVNYNSIFRPNLILDTSFGFTSLVFGWDNVLQKGWGSKLDIPGTCRKDGDAMPRIRFSALDGLTEIGHRHGDTVGRAVQHIPHLTQALTWLRGRHELKFGWDFRRLQTYSNPLNLAWVNGTFDFARDQTAHPQMRAATGHSFAGLLLGLVNRGDVHINALDPRDASRYGYQAFYIQDNWKVHPRLMLNLGLRYDVPLARYSPRGQFTSFDPTLPNPRADGLPGALAYAGFGPGRINRKRFAEIDWTEFAPRFGLAWHISQKTVLRGGFGISYAPGNHTTGGFCLGCQFGFTATVEAISPDGIAGAFNWDHGVPPPPGFIPPPYIDPSFANGMSPWHISPRSGIQPRQHNFSVNIQRELPGNFLFDIAYVGSRAYNLNSSLALNQVHPRFLGLRELLPQSFDTPAVQALGLRRPFSTFRGSLAQALRPYPQYLDLPDHYGAQGKSWYDSLQVKFEKRFGAFQLYSNYTWSKTLSTLSRSQTAFQDWPQDSYNYDDEKSLMFWDIPHTVNVIQSFDLPFGRGKKLWPDAPGSVNWLISGWTIASVQQYTSGTLVTLSAPVAELGAGGLFLAFRKGNLTGQPIKTGIRRTDLDPNNPTTRWLNPAAVAAPPRYEFGSANRYQAEMRNPMRMTESIALIKRTQLFREGVMFEYRADCFNCFNRTNFGGVVGTLGHPAYGRPTGPQSGPRIITMGLRLTF